MLIRPTTKIGHLMLITKWMLFYAYRAFNAHQLDDMACLMLISVDKTWNRFILNRPLFWQQSVQLEYFVPAKCKTRRFRFISLITDLLALDEASKIIWKILLRKLWYSIEMDFFSLRVPARRLVSEKKYSYCHISHTPLFLGGILAKC